MYVCCGVPGCGLADMDDVAQMGCDRMQSICHIYMSFRMPSGMSDRMPQRRLQCMLDRCPRRGLLEENNLIR